MGFFGVVLLPVTMVCWLLGHLYLELSKRLDRRNYEPFLNYGASHKPLKAAAWLIGAFVAAEAILYLLAGDIILYDAQAGSTIATLRWLAGGSLYHLPSAEERYALLYGPLTFLLYAPGLLIGSILATKITGLAALLAGVVAFIKTIKAEAQSKIAFWMPIFAAAAFIAIFANSMTSARADAALFALAATAVLFAGTRHGLLVIAACAALAFNFKITAVIYFIPPLLIALTGRQRTAGEWASAIALGMALAIAPFMLPGVDLAGYLFWLKAGTSHALRLNASLTIGGQYIGVLVLPVHFLIQKHAVERRTSMLGWALLGAAAFYAVIAFKVGAGPYHFVPLIPSYGYFLARLINEASAAKEPVISHKSAGGAGIGVLLLASIVLIIFSTKAMFIESAINSKVRRVTPEILAELKSVIGEQRQAGRAVAYAPGNAAKNLVNIVPNALLMGATHLVNDVAEWDMYESKIPPSEATMSAVKSCKIPVWITPHGDEPFVSEHLYRPAERMFKEIASEFAARYQKTAEGKYFDVWQCNL